MPRCHLRVYYGPESTAPEQAACERVTLPLKEVVPLLADAVHSQRTWLADFEDDEITVSADLYEMLLAYQHYRRPSA
ncbi:MAG: hypothetical protein K6T86_17025 [Pirellulales bacterium]|nr:hypothetical protein [Pirellulales bacterium]